MFDVFVATLGVAVAGFSILLLLIRQPSPEKIPLLLVLLCLFVLSTGPLVFELLPQAIQFYVSFLPLVFFTLLPCVWFYHQALTAYRAWHWKRKMWKHFISLPIITLFAVMLALLPRDVFNDMFFSEHQSDNAVIELFAVMFFVVLIVWCILSCAYIVKLTITTHHYRKKIKQVYASEHGKTLNWLLSIIALIVFTWLYAFVVLLMGDRLSNLGVSESGVFVLLTSIVWLMSANGLRQRPGFEDESPPKMSDGEAKLTEGSISGEQTQKTYERSALTTKDLAKIAEQLTEKINQDAVHLTDTLTLAKLSKMVSVPPQYVSQTLSQHMKTNFFDFINSARIDSAKQLLVESNASVLDIAMATGFNSRSSFYKAFKQFAGVTPSQYRKSN